MSKKINELRQVIRKNMVKTLYEYNNYDYPAGADTDSNAPWNQKDASEPKYSKHDIVNLLWHNDLDELAVLKHKESGNLLVLHFDNSDDDLKEFGYDYWNGGDNGSAVESYVNDYWNSLSKGDGYDDFERGEKDLVKIDQDIAKDLISTFGNDVAVVLK